MHVYLQYHHITNNLLRRLVGLQITHQNYHNIFDMICLDIYHYLVTKNYMYTDLSFWIWFFSFIFMQISSSIVDWNSLTIATTNQPPSYLNMNFIVEVTSFTYFGNGEDSAWWSDKQIEVRIEKAIYEQPNSIMFGSI